MDSELTPLDRYFSTGEEKAFAEVVASHLPLVFSAALRITRDRPLAEEIAQLVFSRLAGLRHGLPPGLSLATWLHRTTRTAALNALRAEQRRQRREETAALHAMNESRFPWEQISPVLDEVIGKLSAQDRELILSRFFLGESSEEVARRLGLGQEAVKKRLQRALGRLRDHLGHRGIRTTTAALSLSLPAFGVETIGSGLSAAIASTAVSSPLASSTFTILATLAMKHALTLSTLAVLAASSLWMATQARSAAALEVRIADLRQRISTAETAAAEPRRSGSGGAGELFSASTIDWRRFLEMRRLSGDDVTFRKMIEEMNHSLGAMSADGLSAELERLAALQLREDDQFEIEALLLGHLTNKDPQRVLHYLEGRLADDRTTPRAFMAFRKWLDQDAAEPVRWLDQQIAAGAFVTKTLTEENPVRKWLEGSLLPSLLTRDPAAALARLQSMPIEQRRGVFAVADIPAGMEAEAARTIVASVAVGDRPLLLADLARQVDSGGESSAEALATFLETPGVMESAPDLMNLLPKIADPQRRAVLEARLPQVGAGTGAGDAQ